MPANPNFQQRCGACGSSVRRAHRDSSTRRETAATGMRRYRCVAEGCAWTGLLPRLSRVRLRTERAATMHPAKRWGWVVLAMSALGVAAAAVVNQGLGSTRPVQKVPAGESYYGSPLRDAHPLQVRFDEVLVKTPPGQAVPGLVLRQHCAWGKPGGNPYKGTALEALQAAGLPADVVAALAEQIQRGAVTERLTIANDGIRGHQSGRVFSPSGMAMTYGRTLCLGTRVNFAAGHTEPASLFEATDAQGRLHTVMVPDVCGNVTMISQGTVRADKTALTGGSANLTWLVDLPETGRGIASSTGGVNSVPEPGTLWGVGMGLVILAWLRRRQLSAQSLTSGPEKP